jgi:hypothetical protein
LGLGGKATSPLKPKMGPSTGSGQAVEGAACGFVGDDCKGIDYKEKFGSYGQSDLSVGNAGIGAGSGVVVDAAAGDWAGRFRGGDSILFSGHAFRA